MCQDIKKYSVINLYRISYMTSDEQSEMRCNATLVDLHFVRTTTHGWWLVELRYLDDGALYLYFEYAVTNVCWLFGI